MFVVFYWTHSSTSMYLIPQSAGLDIALQRWSLQFKQRGRTTSHNLLKMLFQVQLRMLLVSFAAKAHWCLTINPSSTMTPGSFSAKLLSKHLVTSLFLCMGCSSPDAGLVFPLDELHEIPICPRLQPVEVPLNRSTTITPPSFVSSTWFSYRAKWKMRAMRKKTVQHLRTYFLKF